MSEAFSMKTPMKKVRGLGSAKSGTDHFWKQRLTAMANVVLALVLVVLLATAGSKDPVAMRAVSPHSESTWMDAPSRAKKRWSNELRMSAPWVPASPQGSTDSLPKCEIDVPTRSATSARASSQVAVRNSPAPLVPIRMSGERIRSGLYTRSRNLLTLGHSSPNE